MIVAVAVVDFESSDSSSPVDSSFIDGDFVADAVVDVKSSDPSPSIDSSCTVGIVVANAASLIVVDCKSLNSYSIIHVVVDVIAVCVPPKSSPTTDSSRSDVDVATDVVDDTPSSFLDSSCSKDDGITVDEVDSPSASSVSFKAPEDV